MLNETQCADHWNNCIRVNVNWIFDSDVVKIFFNGGLSMKLSVKNAKI